MREYLSISGTFDAMNSKPNILVICGRNKRRSRTAEYIFKNDDRINIRSAGLSPSSDRKISENDVIWADIVFVMESEQRRRIKDLYPSVELPPIEVLNIEDEYEFMDEELVMMLQDKINDALRVRYEL